MSDDEQINQSRLSASIKQFSKIGTAEQEKLIKNFIRVALFAEESRRELSREEIINLVLKDHPKVFLAVFQKAQHRLRELFGFELVQVEARDRKKKSTGKLKNSYILRSSISESGRKDLKWKDNEENWMKLLVVVLTIILGSGRVIEYEELLRHLDKLNVNFEDPQPHPDFGDLRELMALWIKMGYLDKFRDEHQIVLVAFGPRSKVLFSDSELIEFITTIGGGEKREQYKLSVERAANVLI